MPATQTPQQAIAAVLAAWMARARETENIVQQGQIASGQAGGGAASVNWANDLPESPSWAEEIMLQITLPVSLTLPASGSVVVSPYAPYSALQRQLVLGGAVSLPFTSGVPYWLDDITSRRNYDPSEGVPASGLPMQWTEEGAEPYTLDGLSPGATISNGGTAEVTSNYTLTWYERIRLGRNLYGRRNANLYGCIPLGDPDHRPLLNAYLGQLIGTDPVNNLFVANTNGCTAVTNGAATVTAIWRSAALDILPPGFPQLPPPRVMMALALTDNGGLAIPNAGTIVAVKQRTAMIYTKIFHLLVNDQLPLEANYFGLWLTGDQQSARWEFDANLNNFWDYYRRIKERYGRFLPEGVFVADLAGGHFPEFPRETPYEGVMSPDVTYAAQAGVPPTPSQQTGIRIPAGTTINQASVRELAFGLVNVTY